ncbi:MAG: hypothetical protein U0936_24590 [Planctomycetaceae bacterium]
MAKKEQTTEGDHVTLKIKFTSEEHKKLRMAAAELEITIAEFMRSAVLGAAQKAVHEFFQRELAPKRRGKSNQADE